MNKADRNNRFKQYLRSNICIRTADPTKRVKNIHQTCKIWVNKADPNTRFNTYIKNQYLY